ncbi:MAG TPA: hypothetical protein V6D18_20530, partial [Thermosynechococcaceae cyanobacterium]
ADTSKTQRGDRPLQLQFRHLQIPLERLQAPVALDFLNHPQRHGRRCGRGWLDAFLDPIRLLATTARDYEN